MVRLLQIGFIWFGCAVAWMVLGSTILVRTGGSSSALTREVQLLWGPEMRQQPPRAVYHETRKQREWVTGRDAMGQPVSNEVVKDVDVEIDVPLTATDAAVKLSLDHRRKGLLWFATYGVDFRARYTFSNSTGAARRVAFRFPLVGDAAVYDGFEVRDADGAVVPAEVARGLAHWSESLAAGERRTYAVAYRSRGTTRWDYELANGAGQVRDFRLGLETDFDAVNFPAGTISPSRHGRVTGGWRGEWAFTSLVASQTIGVELPQRPSPGPLASRITFFAPVGLLFFFFVVAVLALARGRAIHPLNYFFFGCAFFAFHLLFAYLVDHLALWPAFALSAGVSSLLVVSYGRLFVGWRFALLELGLSQLVYLILFSFTFFFQGFTGLSITVGAVLTLAVMMQLTGRVSWAAASKPAPPASPPAVGPPPAPAFAPPGPPVGPPPAWPAASVGAPPLPPVPYPTAAPPRSTY
jgi:hypothetical protein